jgi:hypothetical protein
LIPHTFIPLYVSSVIFIFIIVVKIVHRFLCIFSYIFLGSVETDPATNRGVHWPVQAGRPHRAPKVEGPPS